jgi:DNA polymerase (family 10)
MSNEEIVEILEMTVKLLELHNADAFKTRAFSTAAFNLDRFKDTEIASLPAEELTKIQGVGKSTAVKIVQLVNTGHLPELDELVAQTPAGVLEMFKIKGIGPKKIGTIWRDLGITTVEDLKTACENGQIAKLKGFGEGTQQKILASLAFLQSQVGKLRMDKGEALAGLILEELQPHFAKIAITGEVARKCEIVETIQLLIGTESPVAAARAINEVP